MRLNGSFAWTNTSSSSSYQASISPQRNATVPARNGTSSAVSVYSHAAPSAERSPTCTSNSDIVPRAFVSVRPVAASASCRTSSFGK